MRLRALAGYGGVGLTTAIASHLSSNLLKWKCYDPINNAVGVLTNYTFEHINQKMCRSSVDVNQVDGFSGIMTNIKTAIGKIDMKHGYILSCVIFDFSVALLQRFHTPLLLFPCFQISTNTFQYLFNK